MGRFVLMLCMLASLSMGWAQPAGRSALRFTQDTWDFGTIREADGKVSHTFEFSNISTKPLVIEKVVASCGCTEPEYTQKPVLPGRTGKITVTFDPKGRPGPFNKNIYVTTTARDQKTLTITGTVEGIPRSVEEEYPLKLSATVRARSSSLSFSLVRQGSVKSMTIPCVNTSKTETVQLGVDLPVRDAYYSVVVPAELKPGEHGEITVTYDLQGQKVWGMLSNRFIVTVNGQKAPLLFSSSAVAVEDFSHLSAEEIASAAKATFATQFFRLGEIVRGDSKTMTVRLTNVGKSPLVIRAVNNSVNAVCDIQPGTTVAPGETLEFPLTFKTGGMLGTQIYQSVFLTLNDPSRPFRELRMVGEIVD